MTLKDRISQLPGATTLWHKLRPSPGEVDYHSPIRAGDEANNVIHALLTSAAPFLVARIGGNELNCLRHYLGKRRNSRPTPYPSSTVEGMLRGPGFFGATNDTLDEFANEYLRAIQLVDAIGIWFLRGESRVVREYCPLAELLMLRDIEPYYNSNPWSRALSGKRVLVIHPFAESIKENYKNNREFLFRDPDVLPLFDLQVMKAVQSIAGEPTEFESWFDALAHMKREMDERTFDVCLVGAGAYGLPLAAHAKKSGLQAIHMGGATQILFGIRGRRWDEHETISSLYNQYWIRPKPSEVPRNFRTVEGGAYW